MIANKNDPRVIRSKQLIKDALIKLMMDRDFESITVKDITELATINRATFYAHYVDKYMLLEVLFLEFFDQTLARNKIDGSSFSIETLEKLIMAVCDYFMIIKNACRKISSSVMSLMEEKIISRLAAFIERIAKPCVAEPEHFSEELELSIIIVSWSIYGVALQWNNHKSSSKEELAVKSAKLIQNGANGLLLLSSAKGVS